MLKAQGLILLIIAVFLAANTFLSNDEAVKKKENKELTYGERGLVNSWPAIDQSGSTIIDNNLTAANYYVVVDGSGSMGESNCSGNSPDKMGAAKSALRTFFSNIPRDANVGLYAFDLHAASERIAIAKNTQNDAIRYVDSMSVGGGTPLASAITSGIKALSHQAKKQLGYGEYHLVVITDGQASGGQDPSSVVKNMLADSPILLHTIGFCIGEQHSLNQPGYTLYQSANNPESLKASLNAVLAEAPNFQVDDFQSN